MALILAENRNVVEQHFDLTNSPIMRLKTSPEQPNFYNLPYKDVRLLFVEGSNHCEQEILPFDIPTDNVWPKSHASSIEDLENMLLSPHLHIPRILYSASPNTALKLAVQHIFKLAYAVESMDTVVQRLFVTEPFMFKGFELFNKINISL